MLDFNLQYHKHQGILLYDNRAGCSYTEAEICSWSVSKEQLFNTAARHPNDQRRNDPDMKWPPTIAELENNKESDHFRKNMLACLFSIHNTISLSHHEQVCLSGIRFERYFSHHPAT